MIGQYWGADVEVKTFFRTRYGWLKEINTSLEQWKKVCEGIDLVRKYKVPASIEVKPLDFSALDKVSVDVSPIFQGELKKIEVSVFYDEV